MDDRTRRFIRRARKEIAALEANGDERSRKMAKSLREQIEHELTTA